MLSCGVFAKDDSLNVPRSFTLYLLSCMINGEWIDPGSFLAWHLYSVASSIVCRIVIGVSSPPFIGIWELSLALRIGYGVWAANFPLFRGPPYFIGLTFSSYQVMLRSSNPHLLYLLIMVALALPPMIIRKFRPPLGPFRRSKLSTSLCLNWKMPLFVTFSKSSTVSFMGWLFPTPNISMTLRPALRQGEIGVSLKANPRTLLPLLRSECSLVFPPSLIIDQCLYWGQCFSKHEELIDINGVRCCVATVDCVYVIHS